ncbi:MAG: class II fructose-bisphosphatase [Bdellovibrionales bacterium]|nr:class II fructose-bisphosphatase [Bdellovibrionales bacterium]
MGFLEDHILRLAGVTEASALACFPLIGKGDGEGADRLAVDAMRAAFQCLPLSIRVVIGEGERDKAPRLYTGEKLGDFKSSLKVDVAVDPLEGTALCARGEGGALSVMALAPRGSLFMAPDIYMKKIACGPKAAKAIDLKASTRDNILAVASALGKKPEFMSVGVLDRPRHEKMISEIRETGASVYLVEDGDVALALNTVLSSLDLLMGTGGAPEGVLAAVALKCLGGGFQGQLVFKNDEEEQRAGNVGVKDLHKIWTRDELVKEEGIFCATGVTTGSLVKGIQEEGADLITHTFILTSHSKRTLIHQRFIPSPV